MTVIISAIITIFRLFSQNLHFFFATLTFYSKLQLFSQLWFFTLNPDFFHCSDLYVWNLVFSTSLRFYSEFRLYFFIFSKFYIFWCFPRLFQLFIQNSFSSILTSSIRISFLRQISEYLLLIWLFTLNSDFFTFLTIYFFPVFWLYTRFLFWSLFWNFPLNFDLTFLTFISFHKKLWLFSLFCNFIWNSEFFYLSWLFKWGVFFPLFWLFTFNSDFFLSLFWLFL